MLTLKVEYLTGMCMATRHNDPSRSTPEWPPHPDRLYSAMVAAVAEPKVGDDAYVPDAAKHVLRWLAEQSWNNGKLVGPQLSASDAFRRSAPDVHMPSNPHEDEVWQKPKRGKPSAPQKSFDLMTLLPVRRKKAALPIPAVVPEDPVVYFIWPNADANGHLEVLKGICARVTCLGRSRSLVRVSVAENSPQPTHVPDALGQMQLRIPGPTRLDELIDNYKRQGGKPEPSPPRRYRCLEHDPRTQKTMHSVFDRVFIFQPQRGDPTLPGVATLKVTQAFRKGLIACINEDQRTRNVEPTVPDIVHGHGEHPHCAYVALPFVHPWQRHADGAIKGLAVFLPRDVAEEALHVLAAGLLRLQANSLGIQGVGTWHLEEVPADDPPMRSLDARTWTGPANTWTTATPMVFGHFPKEKNGGEVKVILESLGMIGIEPARVVEISVGRHSPLHGAPPSWCFKRQRDQGGTPPRLIRHVTLRFDRPVRGPLVLGCMRYFGLGLMRPLEE